MSLSTNEKIKRKRSQLWGRQNGKCYWCKKPMIFLMMSSKVKGKMPHNLCTLDHLYDRFHPDRLNHRGEKRYVAACWSCNHNRSCSSVKSQPIEVLRAKSGRRKPMSQPDKPHYVYIRKEIDGGQTLVIMSRKQEVQEQPLTFDLAMKFSRDFAAAAVELHKQEITQLGNKEKQEDLFNAEAVQPSGRRPSSDDQPRDIPTGAPV